MYGPKCAKGSFTFEKIGMILQTPVKTFETIKVDIVRNLKKVGKTLLLVSNHM